MAVREIEEMSAVAPSPEGVGPALRRARRKRRTSLSKAAEETRIWSRYLEALEDDASIDEFPAPVYARYFLREYAQYLGLDPEPLLETFDRQHGLDLPAPEPALVPVERPPRRWPGYLLVGLSVLALVAIFVAAQRSRQEPLVTRPVAAAPAPAVPSPAPAPAVPSPAPADRVPPKPPAVRGVRAVLEVNAPCWIRAVGDGRVLVQQTLPAGRRVTLTADRRLDLVLGNAGGVSLEVNGRSVPTGASGQVVRFSFEWRNGHLVTLRS